MAKRYVDLRVRVQVSGEPSVRDTKDWLYGLLRAQGSVTRSYRKDTMPDPETERMQIIHAQSATVKQGPSTHG